MPSFKAAVGGINDNRMGAKELVLRFVGFYLNIKKNNPKLDYRGDMNEFLDRVNDELNKITSTVEADIKKDFDKAMQNAFHLFGKFAFRKCSRADIENEKNQLLNKALFVTWAIVLTEYDFDAVKQNFENRSFALELANELVENIEYYNCISYRSSDRKMLEQSFTFARDLIKRFL